MCEIASYGAFAANFPIYAVKSGHDKTHWIKSNFMFLQSMPFKVIKAKDLLGVPLKNPFVIQI